MGKLIAVEGVDASGKQTQTELLYRHLVNSGYEVRRMSFPMYDSNSSAGVKMYLNGELSKSADGISAYAASSLFAADRFLSYRSDWKADYDAERLILCDRYIGSNMIHQACKLPEGETDKFLEWLDSFEHGIYGLPRADLTIFLDMPTEYGRKLMENRANKIDNSQTRDIHERDSEFIEKSYKTACKIAEKFEWTRISCVKNGEIRSVEDISKEIISVTEDVIAR